ncbi:DNA-binding transcriptional regulator, ArsR family [Halolactibacillus halophilus]|uniref:Transcriptional regulator n=1 Tax=Halolactibacillus halophilus TaxID=306540 RepID=A0A1I5SG37_9BACI|nr:metalloregulator ArsR/SmtB family transcription factor [Halolactibacillus halophilus]GEM02752.1 transcriptional regulator [Halolactibacillus halophilus]SFP69675.1 DNA-binding transcriptional regulator, ArsR family [Halolactibacillus halophilus]
MSEHIQETCDVAVFNEDKVYRVKEMVESENILAVSEMFKALCDETRLKIAYALTQEDKLCVCDVAHIIGASTATASHHLRHLKKLGLAKSYKEGKQVYYQLDDDHVKTLITIGLVHQKEVKQRGIN